MDELSSRLLEASPEQRQRYLILHAHQQAIKGEFKAATQALNRLIANKPAPDVKPRTHALLSQIHHAQSDYINAFSELQKALTSISDVSDPKSRIDVLEVAGRLFSYAGEPEKAAEYSAEALNLAEEIGDPLRICFSWAGLTEALRHSNRQKDAVESAIELEKACTGQAETHVGIARQFLAQHALDNGDIEEALTLASSAKRILLDNDYKIGLVIVDLTLARINLAKNKQAEAFTLLSQARAGADALGMLEEKVEIYEMLAKIGEASGDWKMAAESYKALNGAKLTVIEDEKSNRSALFKIQFDNQLQEQQIALLEKEKQLLRHQSTSQNEKRRTLQLGVGIVSIICILLMLALHRLRNQSLQLRKLAQVDGLTGLHNRRHALMLAEQLYASCLRRNSPLAVVMVDLDLFKEINDRFGHAAGDEVLRSAARHFASCLRRQDVIGRTGGEEFAIFLPDTDLNAAITVVERCRNGLGEVQEGEQSRRVTASFGIAVASDDRFTLDELLQQADKALYSAKANGRNQVVIARDLAFAASAYDEPASLI